MYSFFDHCTKATEAKFQVTKSPIRDCLDIGKEAVNTETECQEAAIELGLKYYGSKSWSMNPKACSSANGQAIWNTHETGTGRSGFFSICRKGGEYIP